MAPRYVRVPAKRAEQLVAVGHAVRVDEADVPKGEQVVVYSEQDFAWAPPTMKAPEKPLEVNDILREFGWTTSPALFDSARSLGFPSPNRTHFELVTGSGGARAVSQWSAEAVRNSRERIRALKVG